MQGEAGEEEACKARLGKRRHARLGWGRGGMQGQAGEVEACKARRQAREEEEGAWAIRRYDT